MSGYKNALNEWMHHKAGRGYMHDDSFRNVKFSMSSVKHLKNLTGTVPGWRVITKGVSIEPNKLVKTKSNKKIIF